MKRRQLRVTVRLVATFASTAMLMLGNVVTTSRPAGADPLFPQSYVGVGSDTIQDVMNALSGAAPYSAPGGTGKVNFYTPIHSSQTTGSKTITSWDAVDPGTGAAGCLTPKIGFPQIDRPNGSAQGHIALSRAIDGGAYHPTANCGASSTTTNNVIGAIDFARSSAGPSSFPAGTQITDIPFARDAVTYAYFDHGSNEIAALTTAQLQALYGTGGVATGGTITLTNGHTVFACMVQSGSGTGKFWDKAMGNSGNGAIASQSANTSGCGSTYEENGANSFLTSTFVSGLTSTQDVVIPFSVGSWISQLNGVANDRSSTGNTGGVSLGSIDGTAPTTGTKPSLAPNSTFYANTTYGRDLYILVATSRIGTFGDGGLKSLFVGSSSALCAASSTINLFGFSEPPSSGACGSVTQTTGLDP